MCCFGDTFITCGISLILDAVSLTLECLINVQCNVTFIEWLVEMNVITNSVNLLNVHYKPCNKFHIICLVLLIFIMCLFLSYALLEMYGVFCLALGTLVREGISIRCKCKLY